MRLDAFVHNSVKFPLLLGGKADAFGYRDPCHVPGRGLILHASL